MAVTRIGTLAREILARLAAGLLVITLARAALDKFSPDGGYAVMFTRWGYPVWFRTAVGVVEVIAAGMLLWPRAARWGARIVLGILLGAAGTRVLHGEFATIPVAEFPPAVLALIVLLLRRQPRTPKREG